MIPRPGGSPFAALTVRRLGGETRVFQRTDDMMSSLVVLVGVVAQLGCLLWPLLEHPLETLALSPVVVWLFLRSGTALCIRPGEVSAWKVVFGLPLPGRTTLRAPVRLERRSWEQHFGVFLPMVALVDGSGAIELRVQPGQEHALHHALAEALVIQGPPTTF